MNNPNTQLFQFCPECGLKKLVPDSVKSFICQDCGFKFYLNCAAAAIALITDTDGRILVTKRKYDPFKGMLDFPGGFAEPGESIEQALIREVKEELFIETADLRYLMSLPNTYLYKDVSYPITDFVFLCQARSLDPISAGDDIDGYDFILPHKLDENDFGLDSAKKIATLIRTSALPGLR